MKSPENFCIRDITTTPDKSATLDLFQSKTRLLILLALTVANGECGPANFSKNIEDIDLKEESGITFLTDEQKGRTSAEFETRRILPPDELAIFEKYRNAGESKEKIDWGFYFIANYPNSLIAPRIKFELKQIEAQLWDSINSLFSTAKRNPAGFLSSIANGKRDEFLYSVFLFASRFPRNPNRNASINLIQNYVEIMNFACVKIDSSDSRLTNQTAVKSGEFAFAKFYRHYEHVNPGQMWNLWTPVTKFDFYEWVVISTDGERVGISEMTQRSEGAGMLVETAVSGLQTYLVVTDTLNRALQYSVESGLLSPEVLDAYDRIGNSATPTNNDDGANTLSRQSSQQADLQRSAVKSQKKDECDLSCKSNWVDNCGHGLHTLLPGENYTKPECDSHFYECLDLCEHKYPSDKKP